MERQPSVRFLPYTVFPVVERRHYPAPVRTLEGKPVAVHHPVHREQTVSRPPWVLWLARFLPPRLSRPVVQLALVSLIAFATDLVITGPHLLELGLSLVRTLCPLYVLVYAFIHWRD